jgi:zinc protease
MLRSLLLGSSLAVLISAAPMTAAAQTAPDIAPPPLEFTHRELSNGLDVYAMPDPTSGTVTVQLWYDVGGKDDPQGRSGFAHLFEHILSRKTVNIPYGGISTMVENAGGARNASTGQDFTNYYETVPPQYLETMLWTHAERMARPVVDQAVFDAERSIVQEELRQRVYAPPYGRLQRFVIGDNAYDEHVYRRSVIGSLEELDAAGIDDARAFHEAYYRPATATMIVSGNFDPAELDRLVDQYFGDIRNPDRPVPVLERPVPTPRTQPRSVIAYAPNVPLPAIAAVFPGVDARSGDSAALDVMSAVMSRGQSSRLFQSLVYGSQVAASAGLGANADEEGGTLTANVTVAAGREIEEAEAALNAELARIRDEPITDAELIEAQTELLAADLRQRETASGRAFMLGNAVVAENDPRAPDRRVQQIRAVTAADVQRVARRYLDENARVSIRYLDDSQRPEGVAEDSWKNPAPIPTFLSVPPAILPANELRAEGEREAPPAPGEPRVKAAPEIVERTLSNGLRVIVARSTDLPIMNAQLVIAGGAASDPADRAGLADFTAGLASQGAGDRSAPEIARALEAAGAVVGGGAGADSTTLSVSAPIASAGPVGDILSDIVERPTFAEAELERSRTRTVNALTVALRQPGPLASLVLQRVAFGDAPYGASSSGLPASVRQISRGDVQAHHDRWWRPDNAALIITGGMSAEEGFAFAERTLGDWARPADPMPRTGTRAGEARPPRIVVVDLPGAGQAAIAAGVRGPSRSDPDFYPLAVANAVLGGGQNGHLFQEVRAKRGLSYGANSSLPGRAESGLLTATTQTKNESALEVVDLVLAQMERVRTEAIAEQTLADRETYLAGGFSRAIETTGGLGGFLADAVTLGLPLDESERYAERIRATTPETMRAASARLDPDQAYVVVVGDGQFFLDAMRAAHPDLVVIPAAELDLMDPTLGL